MPTIYFEVFEWTEAQALPPNYTRSGSKAPALQPTSGAPRSPFSLQALYSPFPENSPGTPHSTPAAPISTYTRIHALSSLSAPCLSPWGAPSRPPKTSPRSLRRRSSCCPRKRILPPRPPPQSPRLQTSPGNPDHEVRDSLPHAPHEVTPARLREEVPSWPRRPLHPPDWAGRRPRHTSPRALAQPNTGSGAALPDPPLVSRAQRETKGRAPRPVARPILARSPPGPQQSPSRCLAPPAWLTHRSPHASCRRGNPPPSPTGAAWTSSDFASGRL